MQAFANNSNEMHFLINKVNMLTVGIAFGSVFSNLVRTKSIAHLVS